jgi:hypothetical protein
MKNPAHVLPLPNILLLSKNFNLKSIGSEPFDKKLKSVGAAFAKYAGKMNAMSAIKISTPCMLG